MDDYVVSKEMKSLIFQYMNAVTTDDPTKAEYVLQLIRQQQQEESNETT